MNYRLLARPLIPLVVACLGLAACTGTSEPDSARVSVAPGTSHVSLRVDGRERSYRLFVPRAAEGTAGPFALVIGLHGGLGSGDQFAAASRIEVQAEARGFVAAFPDGVDRTWNAGTCCGRAAREEVDDTAFLSAVIADIGSRVPFDPARVFVTGHSNGAMMAFRFGCERADLISAIAPVAGSLEIERCEPSKGVRLLAIHGDADRNHPIEGGSGDRSISGVAYRSMNESLQNWTSALGCSAEPKLDVDGVVTTATWTGCRDAATAKYVVVAGADHPWPGSKDGGRGVLQGEASRDFDATAAVVTFFLD